jgi:cell division protein FtsB
MWVDQTFRVSMMITDCSQRAKLFSQPAPIVWGNPKGFLRLTSLNRNATILNMKRILRILLIVLIPALLIGAAMMIVQLNQQLQTLQTQYFDSRLHEIDLQAELDQVNARQPQLQNQIKDLQAQIDALTKQLKDAGVKITPVVSPQNNATMEAIEKDVQQIRGLTATRSVTRTLLTKDDLRQHVIDMQQKNYSQADAQRDTLTLSALDLLPPTFDLYQFIIDLYAEQIAGFYEPDTKQLYVIAEPGDLSVLEKITFAHEFDHALQDQHFDLAQLGFTNDKSKAVKDADRQLAYQSLVEGDATLLMQQWLQEKLSALDLFGATAATPDTPIFNNAPRIFREQLLFPYESGLTFVTNRYVTGGWPALDQAFAQPPVSTEQILHPDRYPNDQPLSVTLPGFTNTLPTGWHAVDENTLGEFMLRQYLDQYITRTIDLDLAAEGWGGDRYAVYASSDNQQFVLIIESIWDSAKDADEFAQVYKTYADNRFESSAIRSDSSGDWWNGPDVLNFSHADNRIRIIVGPNESIVQAIIQVLARSS